jgi:hypothetical protein
MSTIETMTVLQLHAEARRRGKRKYTRLSKAKLIEMLSFGFAPRSAPQSASQLPAPQPPAMGNPSNICPNKAKHSKHYTTYRATMDRLSAAAVRNTMAKNPRLDYKKIFSKYGDPIMLHEHDSVEYFAASDVAHILGRDFGINLYKRRRTRKVQLDIKKINELLGTQLVLHDEERTAAWSGIGRAPHMPNVLNYCIIAVDLVQKYYVKNAKNMIVDQ